MTRLVMNLMAHAMEVTTADELGQLCRDIDMAFDTGKITFDVHELLYKLIKKMNYKF